VIVVRSVQLFSQTELKFDNAKPVDTSRQQTGERFTPVFVEASAAFGQCGYRGWPNA
jgi:hypothetical protein